MVQQKREWWVRHGKKLLVIVAISALAGGLCVSLWYNFRGLPRRAASDEPQTFQANTRFGPQNPEFGDVKVQAILQPNGSEEALAVYWSKKLTEEEMEVLVEAVEEFDGISRVEHESDRQHIIIHRVISPAEGIIVENKMVPLLNSWDEIWGKVRVTLCQHLDPKKCNQ